MSDEGEGSDVVDMSAEVLLDVDMPFDTDNENGDIGSNEDMDEQFLEINL